MPKIEFIKINNEAVLVICFGYPAFSKNKIGLKNIPPPIPITPETKPMAEPIEKEKYLLIELNSVIFEGNVSHIGKLIKVNIEKSNQNSLFGKVINKMRAA